MASQDGQRQPDQQPNSPVRAPSATSEDSQTLLLNSPPTDVPEEQQTRQKAQEEPTRSTPPPPPHNPIDDDDVQKCWICFSDSTEDTPETSPWRDPCPCALVAHEDCLLDWIADTEAPKNHRGHSIEAPEIKCPQCKADIKLARPRDYLVETVRRWERLGGLLVTPAAVFLLSNLLYRGSMAHGIHSIYRVFGAHDGYRILHPLMRHLSTAPLDFDKPTHIILDHVTRGLIDFNTHWRLYLGVPLLTPLLILSRTSLADSTLPVLPILFFASQQLEAHATGTATSALTLSWPPSAGMSFAMLPYLRAAYNALYTRLFAAKEAQWTREIQPRITQPEANDDDPAAANDNRDDDAENVFEVRIDGDIWQNWVEEEGGNQQQAPEAAPLPVPDDARAGREAVDAALAQAPPADVQAADPPPPIADNRNRNRPPAPAPPQPPAPAANPAAGERRLSFSPTDLASTLLTTLLFPTLAELSGEFLRHLLPPSMVLPPVLSWLPSSKNLFRPAPATGVLQQKWGRSLVGGCLVVVLKDAVGLYVKWRVAGMHRRRRVLDFEGEGGRGRGRG